MIVVAEVKAKFVDEPGGDRGDHGELREVTGGPIRERQTVPRRGGRIEVAVRAPEPLIVVGGGEIIPRRQQTAYLDEAGVLVERARKRSRSGLHLCGETGIGGKERGGIGKTGERRCIVDGKGFVPHLAFVVTEKK
jgi:hypothetical protein